MTTIGGTMRKLATLAAVIVMILAPVTSADAKPVKDDRGGHSQRIDWD